MENETPKPEVKTEETFIHFDNILKHLVTTVIGLILMAASLIDSLTKWDMPSIDGVERKYQLIFVFAVGFAHLFLRDTLIEKVKGIVNGFTPKQ